MTKTKQEPMTQERRALLRFYLDTYRATGACPSMSEARARFGTSRQAIYSMLAGLVRSGHLQYDKPSIRSYRPGKRRPPKEAP